MKRSLIYIDNDYQKDSVDLLAVAGRIYEDEPFEAWALVINGDCRPLEGYFDYVVKITEADICDFDQKSSSEVLAMMHVKYGFDSILVPATPKGRVIAPRTAMRLKTGLVADITDIMQSDDVLELIRPAYSGRIMAGISVLGKGPVMMSVRPGVFICNEYKNVKTEIVEPEGSFRGTRGIKLVSKINKVIEYDIRESDVLVSGGGGISGNFDLLKPLAEALGGQVSASRAVVDKGLVTRNLQVGQSGKTVSPGLYMALGIYGAVQHVEGLKNVENIISVNTSRKAPICSLSDIVVEGDAAVFARKLTEKIRAYKRIMEE